ncbi:MULTISPECIES: phage tail protein [unclassified Undibacterium]|uniref:phage tail protein n=1 Tax=unclassified Undibacterium TaxID=2630295 RepID=UPI002AC989FE|nr:MULTISPECIES: phage tail protein [unclassified Undibacterium]MEB0138000.1 phage tail protein [Undibacterium sp. CCC2.1]MEB0170667.1 phage tail protein [Undibacterium sp. CCC1.1]MEB0177008.1 phage tail protein [Undibacterium sp. CCC3.4]MEB0216296.1 phage tail protein [Undibacterium sp. 5I2]WPX42481.1 phage tail protein [Undibacterium sp. CCC3.4]
MYKPASLRDYLTQAHPDLAHNPDKLLVFADQGNLLASATGSLSFEYCYRLNVIITDYGGDPDALMLPLLIWVGVHQRDLLANPEARKNGIAFEVDFNHHQSIDIAINLDLNERVIVQHQEDGKLRISHPAEPQATPQYSQTFWAQQPGSDLLAEWHTPADVT